MSKYFIIIFIFLQGYCFSQEKLFDSYPYSKLILKKENKELKNLFAKTDTKLNVLFFLSTDCPISLKYINKIKDLIFLHKGKINFNFYLTHQNTPSKMKKFILDYSIDFKINIDRQNKLSKLLGAQVTPEVFVFDNESTLHYHGAIDNWFYTLGKNRKIITSHYLRDAIKLLQNNNEIQTTYVQPVGCYIE